VIKEHGFAICHWLGWEGKRHVMIFQPGNLPVVWYREVPGSRGIGRTAKAGCLFLQMASFEGM